MADPQGRPELRAALADYLARARGVRADPDRIVVCRFTQGLALLTRVLRARGATHAGGRGVRPARAPGPRSSRPGCGSVTLPVDGHGAAVGRAGPAGGRRRAAHSGAPVPARGRARARAAHRGRASGPGTPAAWSSRTTTTGSSATTGSRSAPCRRWRPSTWSTPARPARASRPGCGSAGWCCPRRWSTTVVAAKELADRHASALDQLTLAEFITSGGYDRHVRRSRLAYRRRRDRLVAALRRDAPRGVRVTGIAAGLHALCRAAARPDRGPPGGPGRGPRPGGGGPGPLPRRRHATTRPPTRPPMRAAGSPRVRRWSSATAHRPNTRSAAP